MISRCRQRLPDSGIEFVESNLFAFWLLQELGFSLSVHQTPRYFTYAEACLLK